MDAAVLSYKTKQNSQWNFLFVEELLLKGLILEKFRKLLNSL